MHVEGDTSPKKILLSLLMDYTGDIWGHIGFRVQGRGFPKIRGTFLAVPHYWDHSMFGPPI